MDDLSELSKIEGKDKTSILTKKTRYQTKWWKVNIHIKDQMSFENTFELIEQVYGDLCSTYIFGEEYGESENTPHIEGYMIFPKKIDKNKVLSLLEGELAGSWSYCQPSNKKRVAAGIEYCRKEGNKIIEKNCPEPLKLIKDLYPYQEQILSLIGQTANDRSILWFYGGKNIGKTQILKLMCARYDCHILTMSKKHSLAQVYKTKDKVKIYGFNLTADESKYQTHELFSIIEAVKDGMFSAAFGTECNDMCLFNSKHVVVCANRMPDLSKTEIDADRFEIYQIQDKWEFAVPIHLN